MLTVEQKSYKNPDIVRVFLLTKSLVLQKLISNQIIKKTK